MDREQEIADFQNALLELLDSNIPAREMQESLNSDKVFKPFESYISSFNLEMIEVAAELVKKWGHRVVR